MKNPLLRTIAFGGPAAFVFTLALPAACLWADRRLGLPWPLPGWVSLVAIVLIPAGLALALRSVWLFASLGQGTPNPIAPPRNLVVQGPYRRIRNPMMLGGWMFGIAMAFGLQSPSLLGACLLIIAAGAVYVRCIEEPRLVRRFGQAYRSYMRRVPRWLPPLFLCLALSASLLPGQSEGIPGIVVQIKFEPGRARQWIDAFEAHIAPSIQEAIERKDSITDFAYFENVVIGQPYDFMLVLQSESFDFFDKRRPYPHFEALYRRAGLEKGRKIIAQMTGWEKSVSVTLVRSYRWKR